jgi:predicted NBD/HSP70 family sugar kinase
LGALVRELHGAGPLSRSELGMRTGLTRSTVRALIGELATALLVTEEEPEPLGTPGRPSHLVRPNPLRPVSLGLEIAVDSIAGAVVGFGGDVLQSLRVDRPRGELSLDHTVADLAQLAARLDRFDEDSAIGIGVAIAGVVRRADGVVALAPNLGWRDIALSHALRQSLGTMLPIHIGNEADLGALAEARRGAARGASHILFVSGEVGVGGGVIVDGRPLNGIAGFAGEIGHMPLNPAGSACRCGSVGCWETEVGEDALLARAGRERGGGRDAVASVLHDASSGDERAQAALEHVGQWLGYGLAGLVNVLNPELIVLGGLFGRIYEQIADTVELRLDRYALADARRLVRVVPAALGEDAPLLGAAELAFETFLGDPAAWLRPRPALVELATA